MSVTETGNRIPHFEQNVDQTWLRTIYGIGRAAYTLFNVPDHDSSLYEDLAKVLAAQPQPVHSPIDTEVAAVYAQAAALTDFEKLPRVNTKKLLGHMGLVMQFSSYLPTLRPFGQTPFEYIDDLYDGIVEAGSDTPIGYSEQLAIALRQSEGDLPEAIWRLFLTSRQHGRWFDEGLICNMPDFDRTTKMERMHTFAQSVLACKPHDKFPTQDVAGDTYYTWTHALGTLMFNSLAKQNQVTKLGSATMHNGTNLMHSFAHKYKPQRLPSDHTIAATYGNSIGDALVDLVSSRRSQP